MSARAGSSARSAALRPLTERILARLPGPRPLWIVVWALVPWANAGANLLLGSDVTSAVWEQRRALVIVNYAAVSFAVALTLWGADRLVRRLETFDGRDAFRSVNSVAGPTVAAALTAVAFGVTAYIRDGWDAALLRGATWFVVGIALWSFLWTYGSVLVGLDRIGHARIRADVAAGDPSLGLRPLGGVAFTGLWILVAWLLPIVLTGLPDVVGFAIGMLVLALGLAAFFLSLYRLHRRMVEVKAGELAIARELYAGAYEPVRRERTLEALERQHTLLGAAEALERRARSIHDWPIDEGIVARVLTIATSVVAIAIGRLLLDPFGL